VPRKQCGAKVARGASGLLNSLFAGTAAVCAVSAAAFSPFGMAFAKRTFEMAFVERTTGDPSYRPDPLELFFECDCGEEKLDAPVLAPAEGRLRVAKYDSRLSGSPFRGYWRRSGAGELGLTAITLEKSSRGSGR